MRVATILSLLFVRASLSPDSLDELSKVLVLFPTEARAGWLGAAD